MTMKNFVILILILFNILTIGYGQDFKDIRKILFNKSIPCTSSYSDPNNLTICEDEKFEQEWNNEIAYLKFIMEDGYIAEGFIRKVYGAHLYFIKEAKISNQNGEIISQESDNLKTMDFFIKSQDKQLNEYILENKAAFRIVSALDGSKPYLIRVER